MGVFSKKQKAEVGIGSAPEEPETEAEIKHIEELSNSEKEDVSNSEKEELSYREIPVCLSQAQVNSLVIENNIMLKQLISKDN